MFTMNKIRRKLFLNFLWKGGWRTGVAYDVKGAKEEKEATE